MRRSDPHRRRRCRRVRGLVVVAMACGLGAAAARPARASVVIPAATVADTLHHADVALGRAVVLWRGGDLRGAADLLTGLDLSPTSPWARADRAAFLLAVIERRLGRPQPLREAAAAAADAASASPYRRWLAHLALWDAAAMGGVAAPLPPTGNGEARSLPGAPELEAALLLDRNEGEAAVALLESRVPTAAMLPVHLQLQAMALQMSGRDPEPAWRRLAELDVGEGPDAALVAGARLQLARIGLARGDDVDPWLLRAAVAEGEPSGRAAGQALHLLALTALARGDSTAARRNLDEALTRPLEGVGRRQVLLERGAVVGARGDWRAAAADHAAADEDWRREDAALGGWLDGAGSSAIDALWNVWADERSSNRELRLAPRAVDLALDALAEAALDLRADPEADPSRLLADAADAAAGPGPAAATTAAVDHQPTAAELDEWRRLREGLARAEARRAERAWESERHRQDGRRRLEFLARGQALVAVEVDTLNAIAARLEAMRPRLDAAVAALRALHDRALLSIAERTRALNEELRRDALYARAIRHFHVDGPRDARRAAAAAAAPSAGDLLEQEIALAAQMERFNAEFAARAPELLGRSLRGIWEPRLVEGSLRLHATMRDQAARTDTVRTSLATLLELVKTDPELARRERARAEAAAHAATMADSLRSAKTAIVRDVAARGRARLALEREGIEYHLADAAYWRAVELATDPATAEQPALTAPAREFAVATLDSFLARHPRSGVLSEARFRRADLELFRAQDAFAARMAGYLDHAGSAAAAARALAPLFDGDRAGRLYEAILRDDPSFAHRDAVLFNLGMLKVDGGQPGGLELLAQFVGEFPDAPGAQQAWLRLGDERFDARDYAACLGDYEHAAAGDDPGLAAIALYKLGWAHFAADAFAEAGVVFSRLLDALDAGGADAGSTTRAGGPADLRGEAADHLVQALLRAGGADAFARLVDRVGDRSWDERTLAAMAEQAARYSLDDDAVACDELWLSRYPDHRGALSAAERLVGTLERGRKGDAARRARLKYAARFLPDASWYAANDSLAMRERAGRFARRAYEEAAVFEHQAARAGRDTTAWSRALAHYETFLSHWPDAAEAPRLDYQAGEAALNLREHANAVRHFEAAARCDTAAFAGDASWQAIAARDAWYRSTIEPGRGTGVDSLAASLLAAGDAFARRHPDDERSAELAWRQGQVAYAHGWDDDAARRLMAFSETHAKDRHAAEAARLAGDARYRRRDFAQAGLAYERALELVGKVGPGDAKGDLAAELAAALPLCAYEHAASVAAADGAHADAAAAPLYLEVATRWPGYEHASLALYRAGLGYASAGDTDRAIGAWERIVAVDPQGAYGRDAAVRIAQAQQDAGRPAAASLAWARFSELYPDGEDAPAALLKAIDLRAAAADTAGAESLRDVYLRRFPNDLGTAFAVGEDRARRELATARRAGASVAALAARGGKTPAGAVRRYLDLAEAHPDRATASLLAQVDFLSAEEALRDFEALPLTQPLPPSIERKNRRLEEVVTLFNRCVDRGDAEFAHAAAYRIGEAIIHLGEALLDSERPAGLVGDDLAAYDEVLREQSWGFAERGENAWAQLLRKADRTAGRDPGGWLARTEIELWPRLARRYVHRPELEYPLAAAASRP